MAVVDVTRVLLSVRRLKFKSWPSDAPLQYRYLRRPSRDEYSSVVLSNSAAPPCLHHGHQFLPPPLQPIYCAHTSKISCRATHCATFACLRPIYVAPECIPTARSTSSSAGVSRDPSDFRLSLFPMIWSRNPTWLLSTILIITSDSAHKYTPNRRTACINSRQNKSDTWFYTPSCHSKSPNQIHTTCILPMIWKTKKLDPTCSNKKHRPLMFPFREATF